MSHHSPQTPAADRPEPSFFRAVFLLVLMGNAFALGCVHQESQAARLAAERTLALHEAFDEDGVPMWYVPRGMVEELRSLHSQLALIRQFLETQYTEATPDERDQARMEDD